jgi:hypothetical protein
MPNSGAKRLIDATFLSPGTEVADICILLSFLK